MTSARESRDRSANLEFESGINSCTNLGRKSNTYLVHFSMLTIYHTTL